MERVTFRSDVISISGVLLYGKGDVFEIREKEIKDAYFGRSSGIYYPEKLMFIKLVEVYGTVFTPNAFEEYSEL